MNENKTMFERLESLEFQNEEILRILNEKFKNEEIKIQNSTNNSITIQKKSEQEIFNEFLRKSKKSYLWFGNENDFRKSKFLYTIFAITFLGLNLISTITTSIAINLYSTFTMFENIWVIMAFVLYLKSLKLERKMKDTDLKNQSYEEFGVNNVGLNYPIKEKKVYKIFRVLAYIAFVCNILYIIINKDIKSGKGISIFFELLTLATSIGLMYFRMDLYCQYGLIVEFCGYNYANEEVKLYYDYIHKKFYVAEEFYNNPLYKMIV